MSLTVHPRVVETVHQKKKKKKTHKLEPHGDVKVRESRVLRVHIGNMNFMISSIQYLFSLNHGSGPSLAALEH